jgi:hypothetical protein
MSDEQETDGVNRDWCGRFVKGVSGNPTGRPRGIVSETTRIATLLLSERAPELVNAAIDRALAGKDMPLKLCLDKIIPAPKDQPVAFVMPALGDVIADAVREISEEAGEVDDRVPKLCAPMLRLGYMAAGMLAAIPDRAELAWADRACFAMHPKPPDHPPHPLAAEMGVLLEKLTDYLDRHMARLEREIEARDVAGRPTRTTAPGYSARMGVFSTSTRKPPDRRLIKQVT